MPIYLLRAQQWRFRDKGLWSGLELELEFYLELELEFYLELELEFYLFDRQLHNIGEIISKKMCEIILSGDSHKGTNWPLAWEPPC